MRVIEMMNSKTAKMISHCNRLCLLGLYVSSLVFTCLASTLNLSNNQSEGQLHLPSTEAIARLTPDTPPIKSVIPKSARGTHILDDKWEIRYQHHISFELTANSSRTYLIEVLSEQEDLGLIILNSEKRILEVGSPAEKRPHRKSVKLDLNPDTKYTVIVGSSLLEKDISFWIWATSNIRMHIPPTHPDPS